MRTIQPEGWPRPSGYSNGAAAQGETVFVAGQIGWTPQGQFESDDLVDQVRQALANIRAVLEAAGATPDHIVRLNWFVTDMDGYRGRLKEIGAAYREVMGKSFPAMGCFGVASLVETRAKVEIEATAVIPQEQTR
jgi:enamine deaminase RidA (YjgF/YER057c/UK114 family)